MPERANEDDDRRRSPRFSCAGHAKISCLPSDGIFVSGQILDLSLGGCCVDTTLPIDDGVRTEIVVRVKAASFRAVGEVRAIRRGSGACVEFVHLSAGGKDILADLVGELARLQAVIKKLRSNRRELDTESFSQATGERKAASGDVERAVLFSGNEPGHREFGRKFRRNFGTGPSSILAQGSDWGSAPLVIPVDLFG